VTRAIVQALGQGAVWSSKAGVADTLGFLIAVPLVVAVVQTASIRTIHTGKSWFAEAGSIEAIPIAIAVHMTTYR
jgi:hypothetical protein